MLMTQRTFFRRLLGSLGILLLLSSSSADALALHRCSHHDALPSSDAHHDGHKEHEDAGAPEHEPASGGSESHGCTCVGACVATSAAVVPSSSTSEGDVVTAAIVARVAPTAVLAPAAPDHFLPFATAPPASF
jgi:hypothetical protein